MSERTWGEIEREIRDDYLRADGPESVRFRQVQWDVWLAEVRREAAAKALTEAADELALLNDGGKRGLAGHSKSSASAITHRHAVAVIRARAEAYRREGKGQ